MNSLLRQGYADLGEGRLAQAHFAADRVLADVPDHVGALLLKGLAHYHGGQLQDSVETLSTAISLAPGDAALYYNRARSLQEDGRFAPAVEDYRQALRLAPDFAAAWNNLGALLGEIRDADGAMEAFEKAAACAANDAALAFLARHNLGTRQFLAGRTQAAVDSFKKAAELRGDEAFSIFFEGAFDLAQALSPARERMLLAAIEEAAKRANDPLPMSESYARSAESSLRLEGRKLFILSREHMFRNRDCRKYELTEFLTQSAQTAGLGVSCFMADDITSWPDKINAAPSLDGMLALFAELERVRPEIVLMDGNFLGTFDTLNAALMNELKQRHGFKLAVLIPDSWGSLPFGDYWSEAADVLVLLHPLWRPTRESAACVAVHVPFERFIPEPGGDRSVSLSFTGFIANRSLRAAAFAMMRHQGVEIALAGDDISPKPLDAAALRRRLQQSFQTINFAARPGGSLNINGRVWEAIGAGCLLHEQDNESTRAYLRPWAHYLPFNTAVELLENIEFVRRRPDLGAQVAEQGHAWIARNYPDRLFWQRILQAAFSQGDAGS